VNKKIQEKYDERIKKIKEDKDVRFKHFNNELSKEQQAFTNKSENKIADLVQKLEKKQKETNSLVNKFNLEQKECPTDFAPLVEELFTKVGCKLEEDLRLVAGPNLKTEIDKVFSSKYQNLLTVKSIVLEMFTEYEKRYHSKRPQSEEKFKVIVNSVVSQTLLRTLMNGLQSHIASALRKKINQT